MAKVSNQDIYNQDDNLSMEDYLLGTNNGTANKKTQTYSLGSIFSLFYNFLGFNAFLFTTDTTTYPIGTPGCFFVFDENDDLTNNFTVSRKITFSATDTYNFNVAEYFGIVVNSGKFLFKLINLEDKNNFVFLSPSNFVLGGTGTTFNVDVLAEAGLSNGSFVNYKRYLLVLEFAAGTFDPADYDLTDFTNTSGNPFITAQDLTDALALLPVPITNHSGLILDDGTNPHGTTKGDVGLGNVDNTSDIDKPISTATQTALDEINLTLNPDRVISLGTETIDGNNHTYEGYTWQLGGVQVNNIGNPSVIVIPSATLGFKRKDISVFTAIGTIERVAGTETDGEVVTSPDVPEGTLYYKSYDIDGDTIVVEPEPPVINGTQFKQKNENQKFNPTLGGTTAVITIQPFGQNYYSVGGPVTGIVGFSKALITASPTAEVPYAGKDFYIENKTDHNVTLKNAFSPVDIPFHLGADVIVPTNGIVWLKYNPYTEQMDLFFKSWSEVDLSTKLDKVTTTGVERAYIIKADGSQGTKPTSDFGGGTPSLQAVTDVGNTTTNEIIADGFISAGSGNFGGIVLNDGDLNLTASLTSLATQINPRDYILPDKSGTIAIAEDTVSKVSTSGVERVYTINPDGSQGTKPTSEFKEVIEGYFNGTNFYTDALFTNLITPESGKIYINIAVTPATQYRWSGSAYSQIGSITKNIVTNTSVTGTFNLDANLTDTYVLTLTGNTTLALINFSSTIAQQMTIYITGNFALTYPVGAKVFGTYSTTKTNQLVLERVGSSTYITINNYD